MFDYDSENPKNLRYAYDRCQRKKDIRTTRRIMLNL